MAMETKRNDISIGIPEFYKGRSIFITGFTGYIGKLLVEKLLYSCPELDKIYVLVRGKKGQSPQERAEDVMKSGAFKRLREKYPGVLESKVVAIAGDMLEERLGLSQEHEELLRKEVSIIFHGAASVRFDDPLREAVHMNTLGTKKIVDLALTMLNLACLTYISTAYTNCDHLFIKEEMYPPKADWKKTLEICEKIDPEYLQILQQKYVSGMPNTYAFSKQLAEHVINDYRNQLPVTIVRPAIVVAAWKEPIPGWIDNKYGPMGLSVGGFLGLIRCSWVDLKEKCNYVLSDIVVNAILAATWNTAVTQKPGDVQDSVRVFNICSSEKFNLSHEEFSHIYEQQEELMNTVTADGINNKNIRFYSSEWFFRLTNLYKHVLPALMVDLVLVLNKRKPMLLKVRRKVFNAAIALSYFTTRSFSFQTDKFDSLTAIMSPRDKESFGWDFNQIDYHKSLANAYCQCKTTILKPVFDDLDTNRKRLRMLYYIDQFAVYLTRSLAAFFIYHFRIIQITLFALSSFLTLQ